MDVLLAHDVQFILVGALAAVAQGAPLTTHDVDIVHARTPANLEALMRALAALNACYRGRPTSNRLLPSPAALATEGHSLFSTDLGPLDCLGAIEDRMTYDDLLPHSVCIDFAGRPLRVLSLELIVRNKRKSPHNKDKLALAVLEEALRQMKA
ncbi:MAG: hypothetical protein SF187_06535 [Deltaproteobacteria bacterium]|nr:hypothetical protein [Deltaproteobacteria bacterium]